MSNSKWQKPYVVGYDLGNRTVASVAINQDYNVIRQNGHSMAMVNTFNEGQSKADRRGYRAARRGISHKKWLKKQLYREFRKHQTNGNIEAIQRRFQTSWISPRDGQRYSQRPQIQLYLLNGTYPTVWHAVDALIKDDAHRLPVSSADRLGLIYEVFHNLLGRRGHFLMPNLKVDKFMAQTFDFKNLLDRLIQASADDLGLNLNYDLAMFKQAMTMRGGVLKRKDAILSAIQNPQADSLSQTRIKYLATLCAGGTLNPKQLMKLFDLTHDASSKLQLGSADVDDQLALLAHDLPDAALALINVANQVFYQSQLSFLIQPGKSFVDVQLDKYDQFGKDLVLLKHTVLPHLVNSQDRDVYRQLIDRYLNSRGAVREQSRQALLKTGKLDKQSLPIIQKDFVNNVLKKLVKANYDQPLADLIGTHNIERMNAGDFLVKTRSMQNARIPHQAIQAVIRQIIDVQKQVPGLSWLGQQNHANPWFPDETYDLERFFDFRVPYYVGPLVHDTDQSEFSWLVRKAPGTLTVFNFTDKVDLMKSARAFIARLREPDTYLLNEPTMAASSMTYQKFALLDEMNRLRVKVAGHWEKLSYGQRQSLMKLFKQSKTVSLKAAVRKLHTEFSVGNNAEVESHPSRILTGLPQESPKLSGDAAKFNSSLSTYHKWKDSYGFTDDEIQGNYDDLEQIAEILTVFDQDSKLIKQAALKQFTWLTEDQIVRLSKDHLEGWGRLSKKLLLGIKDHHDESILDNMENASVTLNQVLAKPEIKAQIDKYRHQLMISQTTRRQAIDALLDRSYASPAVRKAVHRFAGSLRGIMKQMKFAPKLIVIESGRIDGQGRTRVTPLDKQIEAVLDQLDQSVQHEWQALDANTKKHLRLAQRLYFLQNGRDIYTGRPMDFNNLANTANIDHVVPQRLYKDDSLDNKVLTTSVRNNIKSGDACAINVVDAGGRALWRQLYQQGLMTKAKYQNLCTDWTDPLSQKDARHMLKRSLVETHQVNKLCAQVATMMTADAGTKVLIMRSAVTTLLRSKSAFHDTKNRDANDLHHGVDAFLIAFAGQYLWTRYEWLHPILDYNNYDKLKVPAVTISNVGFGELFNNPSNTLIANRSTGEIVGKVSNLLSRLNHFKMANIRVHYEHGLSAITAGGTIANATIYPAKHLKTNQNYLQVQGHDPAIYGYRQSITNRKMVLLQVTNGKKAGWYRFLGIPRNWENRIVEYVHSQVKNVRIVRDDLTVFDEFTIPGTGLRLAANGTEFGLHNQMVYPNDLLRQINMKNQLNADALKHLIKHMLLQIKHQYRYMIKHSFGAGFAKLQTMDIDAELAKESDIDHLREIVDDLLIGFNCTKARVSFTIGNTRFSSLGRWKQTYWPNVEMLSKK